MHFHKFLGLLAATMAVSVQAKTCLAEGKFCHQVKCTMEILKGKHDPKFDIPFRNQILSDAKSSIEALQIDGKQWLATDGAASTTSLMPPDKDHKNKWWAKYTIYRAHKDIPIPEAYVNDVPNPGADLPGVRNVLSAKLKDCKSIMTVCC